VVQESQEAIAFTHQINEEAREASKGFGRIVDGLREISVKVANDMQGTMHSIDALRQATERLQRLVTGVTLAQGAYEGLVESANRCRRTVAAAMEEMAAEGADLFDQDYRPIPGTSPQKYRTRYSDAFDARMQSLFDRALGHIDGAVFATAVDVNGYLPTHNSRFQKKLSGDADQDCLNSRDKRIYNQSESEVRRARNTEPLLMQTYVRDTGEVLSEISLPIHVNGRHWGAFVAAVNCESLLK